MTVRNKTHMLTLMAMFAALAYIIMAVGRIPISSVPFLKYDPKDTILVIGSFILGPMPGLLITTVVCLIEMVTVSDTGIIGMIMNLLASAAFIWPAAVIYRKKHTLSGALAGLVVGTITATILMLLWNYFITPYYMGYPREAIAEMLVPVFLPFNLIKGGLNTAVTILIYKPVSRALKRAGLVESKPAALPPKKNALGASILAVIVLITCVLAILVIKGII